jgi:hypothetical protein
VLASTPIRAADSLWGQPEDSSALYKSISPTFQRRQTGPPGIPFSLTPILFT